MGGGGRVAGSSVSLKLNVRWLVCVRTCVTFMCALVETEKLLMQSWRRELSVRVRAFVSVPGEKKWNILSSCQYPSLPPCLIEKLRPRKLIFIYLSIHY